MQAYLQGDCRHIAMVQAQFENLLLKRKHVVGVAIGHKIRAGQTSSEPCLSIFVNQKVGKNELSLDDQIPSQIGGFMTDVVESGPVVAGGLYRSHFMANRQVPRPHSLRHRVRPVEGGFSVGHYQIKGGTMATAVFDANPMPTTVPRYYMLSNNHILANANNAAIGDPILQPAPIDGGRMPTDVVAHLSRFIPLRFDGQPNVVDAALAEGEFHELDREIARVGYVRNVQPPQLNKVVQKTGRTTCHTTGKIIGLNATFIVQYGAGRVAKMCRQIITSNMSAGGDSGSLLCDLHGNAIGLMFAVSEQITLHNDIRYVMDALGIRLV
ncbi:MAG: serine protease [Chloroflexi bacterium]|nr:MAG: serine protease [Chloroflexota bacterium]